ncbi:NUDIX domain-containing protein [Actinoplanes sp. NEAU-A12]|uniref:NUDIX domain-containing protein n=1 Tax=Actinoplanes sandaracinus TaxID=3045177 RepID=A0ABT6WUW4_9ACTN|nr:NUDIX domain-containing protein [Actinoplanes sandaracinus]MDI6103489.1 NUDIX domain-containing protein [Actinoplanes sandaracinus]
MNYGPSFSAPVTAAGAVLWRGAGNAREIVVVHRPHGEWCFPHGRTKPGEHMVAAAVRVVSEKVGLSVRLGPWLGGTDYLKQGWPEHVDYFAAEVDPAATCDFTASDELDDLFWLSPQRAADALSRPDDVRILHELQNRVRVSTSSVILMRPARVPAGSILSAYGAGDLRAGDDPERALRIAEESFATGRPAAVCAELGAIQELSRRLAPFPVDATIPEGGLLVLHGTPERIVSVERHLA